MVPSLEREETLKRCLRSLELQSFKDFEILIDREKDGLAKVRNRLASKATGDILVFIDDDVTCSSDWLKTIASVFDSSRTIAGVSGPAIVPKESRPNRDIFRYVQIKEFYDYFFCDGRQSLPGHITSSGAWTTGASLETCSYEGSVDFLEACNMAFRRDLFLKVGGFDESYKGCGDWSEPDICYKLKRLGFELYFHPKAKVYHNLAPLQNYKAGKKQFGTRLDNYELLSKRWIKPHWKHTLYKLFMIGYYKWKSL